MDSTQEPMTESKWLFPMTLHYDFDDIFKAWAEALREVSQEPRTPIAFITDTSCTVLSKILHPSAKKVFADQGRNLLKQIIDCFRSSEFGQELVVNKDSAYGFAHQVHAACVREYKLTKDKQVIEENIQEAIQETGDRKIYIKFECSGFIPSLVDLLYEDSLRGTGRHQDFKSSVSSVLHQAQMGVVREIVNTRPFKDETKEILNKAPFIQNKADTLTVREAQDFAGKVHKAFVKAFTPA